MKAAVLHAPGGAENLRVVEVPDPQPAPGEALVRLHAAALNHRDIFILQGLYPGIRLPAVLGSDGAGVVTAVGDPADSHHLGREVVIEPGLDWGPDDQQQGRNYRILGMPDDGTFAQLIRIPISSLQPKPEYLSFEEAAAFPLAGLTAYRAVVSRARVAEGETVLVTGIGGGVALFALQIARALGARVFVTSGSEEKIARAIQLGAEGGACYRQPDWGKRLVEMTGGGPHVVIDSAGGESLETAVKIARMAGRIVFYGATTGLARNLDLYRAFFKQLTIMGSTMGSPREFAALVDLLTRTRIRPGVDRVFPLDQAADAHRYLAEATQFGKVVLRT